MLVGRPSITNSLPSASVGSQESENHGIIFDDGYDGSSDLDDILTTSGAATNEIHHINHWTNIIKVDKYMINLACFYAFGRVLALFGILHTWILQIGYQLQRG